MPAVLHQRATPARFRGKCGLCPKRITPHADRIVYVDGKGFVHVECAEAAGFTIVEPEQVEVERPEWWDR